MRFLKFIKNIWGYQIMPRCPRCNKETILSSKNKYRPFCSEKCKIIDFGSWVNEDNKVSRPIQSEDFYED